MSTRLILPLFVSALAWAQPPRSPRPWWDSEVSRQINLSDAQIRQIRMTQKEFRPRMMELRDTVNKAETEVDAAFNEDPVDQAKANDAIDRLATARGELTKAVSQLDLKLRMVLTMQQWKDLQAIQRRPWPGGPGGGRRGPPRSPTGATGTANQQK